MATRAASIDRGRQLFAAREINEACRAFDEGRGGRVFCYLTKGSPYGTQVSKARAVAGRVQVFDITVREWRWPAEVYQVPMTDQQKRDRIASIEVELKNYNSRPLVPHKRQALLHEALDLCTALGLDERWRVFKRRLEALQQGQELGNYRNIPKQ